MKQHLLVTILFIVVLNVKGQHISAPYNVIISSKKAATRVYTEDKQLHVNVSPEDLRKFRAQGWLG